MEVTYIKDKIFEIRNQRVMLDYDLATLYETETRVLNQAVRRNAGRFPSDFMFRLTLEEWQNIRQQQIIDLEKTMLSQNVMTSKKYRGYIYLALVFTEHGVTMLTSVLKSDKAIEMNILIVRTFIALKQFAMDYSVLSNKITQLEEKYDRKFDDIHEVLRYLIDNKNSIENSNRKPVGF